MSDEGPSTTITCDYAPSNRAACKAAKQCLHGTSSDGKGKESGAKLDKGSLRITKQVVAAALGDVAMAMHYHADCFFKVALPRARSEALKNLDPATMTGFSALKPEDQELCYRLKEEGVAYAAGAAAAKAAAAEAAKAEKAAAKAAAKTAGKKKRGAEEDEEAGTGAGAGEEEAKPKASKKPRKTGGKKAADTAEEGAGAAADAAAGAGTGADLDEMEAAPAKGKGKAAKGKGKAAAAGEE